MVLPNSNDETMHFVVDLHEGSAVGRAHVRRVMRGSAQRKERSGKRYWIFFLLLRHRFEGILKEGADVFVICLFRKNLVPA